MKRSVTSIFLVILVGIFMSPHVSLAEENDFILAINDETLSDEERFIKAKDGLGRALTLALEKVTQLESDLGNRQFDEETREAELKALFLEDLAGYKLYYSDTLAAVEALQNLDAVQELAQQVKDYRDATYTPEVEKIVEFVLVFYSEDVLRTATERSEKISTDIEKLEGLGLIEVGKFKEQTDSINTLLTDAADLRSRAKDMILTVHTEESTTTTDVAQENLSSGEPTSTEEIDLPAEQGTSTIEEETTPRTLLQASLNKVKSVYELFLEVSSSVKDMLGLE